MQAEDEGGGPGRRSGQDTVPVVEETLKVGTRSVTTGRVRVKTSTETVENLARVALSATEVEVTRVPVGRVVAEAPEVRDEDGVTIIPVLEEVAVVETRLVLKEEIRIRRRTTTQSVEVPVTLRRQQATVERLTPDDVPPAGNPPHKEDRGDE